MKRIQVFILSLAVFFSSINISFAFEQKTNTNDIFCGISDVFKVQYELYQKTKYNVINVCDIVIKDVLNLKVQNNHEMSFIDLQKQFAGAETALLPPNTVVLSAKFLPVNYKTTKFPLTVAFVLFFIFIFLLRYLGLLRVFWSAVYISKCFKKAYSLYMLSFIFGKKTISLVTVVCFVFSVLTGNLSASVFHDKLPTVAETNGLFSKDFGRITQSVNNNSNLLVVNIQDLHSNPSVQSNINNILTSIDRRYKIKQVFIEGGYGNIDISWLYKIPGLKERNNLVESLLKNGRLTGSEYFAYKTGQNDVLKGLEDEKIHKDNLKRLSVIIDKQEFYKSRLQKIKADIDFINASHASSKNLRLNEAVASHNNGVIDTAKFYKLLFKMAKEINENPKKYRNIMPVDLAGFNNINKYININLAKINGKRLSKEINLFLSNIKSRMSYAEYSEIVQNTDGFSDVSKLVWYIQSLSASYKMNLAKNYPTLYVYANVSILSESMNPVELINEERIFLNNLRQAFSKNDTEYEISFLADFYDVFKKYLTNSLTSDEYEYFSEKIGNFKTLYSKYAVLDRLASLKSDFDMLDSYYSVNNLRNGIFINNILSGREIKHESADLNKDIFEQAKEIVVVVAGGYHTKGIGEFLNDRKISYITVTPNVNGGLEQSEKNYKEIVKEEASVETNALSFTVASCASDFTQFKWGVVSGIYYLNREYSKANIEKVVESMKYLVKDKIVMNFTEEKTEITAGDRKIVLLNYNGQMRTSEDIDENKFQPTTNKINGFGINELFEKYPALDLSQDGLEFKLRHLEDFGITEIKGIDLAVIARLLPLFQEYLFATLPEEIKEKSEKLVIQETIKKHDKTPKLLEELEEMFIERIKATPDYLQMLREILPMHLQILRDRAKDTQLFINPLKKDLKELLKSGKINKSQYTYITAVLFFIAAITDDFTDAADITDKRCDENILKDFMSSGQIPVLVVEKYVDNEIASGIITASARQKRIAVIDDIAIPKNNPASILGTEYKSSAHKWEWIYNLPFSSFISSFIKKHGIQSIAGKEVFEQNISLTEKPAALFAFDALSSLAVIAGTAFGFATGIFPIVAVSAAIFSVTRGIIFAKSHGQIIDKNSKTKIGLYGSVFTLASIIPVLVGLYTVPVIIPFLLIAGQALSASIHKYYNSGLIKAYMNGAKIKVSHVIAAVLIVAVLAAGTTFVNNYFQQTNAQYAQLQQEIIDLQSDNFDIIFSKYLKSSNLPVQERAAINTLYDFFVSNIDHSSYDKFLESLLYIRGEITASDGVLRPSIDSGFEMYAWKDVLEYLDGTIADSLDDIQKNKDLNKMLESAYGSDEISYLEILAVRNDSQALTKIVTGKKDMHYRFYAYMLLNAKDGTKSDGLFDKDEVLGYLSGQYILKDPLTLIEIDNSFQWQALCGMMNFITGAGEEYSAILHDARIVSPGGPQISNASLSYVISGGEMSTSPIFVAAHEVAHIRFLNILGIHENTNGYKISELYAELEPAKIQKKVSLMLQYIGGEKISDLTDSTDDYTVAYVVIEEVRNKVGADSLNLLQDSIIEFLQGRGEKPAENIQKTLKEVIDIFAAKVADSQITSGIISEAQRQDKIKEIADSLIGDIKTKENVSSSTSAPLKQPASAAVFPYGLIGMLFAGIKGGKHKPSEYKHLNYITEEFEREGFFIKKFKKVEFREADNGFEALYKHGLFGKTETVFLSNDISKEEAYTLVKGLVTVYLPTDLDGNLHYYTQFFKRDIRGTIYAPLFKYDQDGKYGFVINILKDKIAKGDRTFRFWSCGSATGEELRTFAWFVRKMLIDLNEDPDNWKLDFYGTDNNKTTAEIASSFNGTDMVENKEVKVDVSGFNIRYVILDHTDMVDLENWLIWQKTEGGFDLICQLNNPTPHQQQEAVVNQVMHPYSMYIHHNQIYDASNKQINIEKSFAAAISVNEFFGGMPEINIKNKAKTGYNYIFAGLPLIFKDLLNVIFNNDGVKQKTAVVYGKIFADNIFYNDSKPEISKDVAVVPVFVIDGPVNDDSANKLNLKPAGIKIGDTPLYYAQIKNVLYLYAEGCGYNDIVSSVQNSSFIKDHAAECLNKVYGKKISSENLDIKELKILRGSLESLKYDNSGILEITLSNFDPSRINELAVSYIDSAARYGFAVRESIFRYIDDFNSAGYKKERINDFINIIEYQKNVSCQIILEYEVYRQLVSDIGLVKFNEILAQAKSKNVSVYIFVSSDMQKTDVSSNPLLYGFVENTDGKYFITDNFTKDSSEAAFASDCDSVQKIISFMEANISKQPVIFKNSLIKKAVDSEQDTVLTGVLKDIFSAGRLINAISAAKSKYSAGKIAKTFSVKELSESFDDETFDRIKKLYGTYLNLSDGEEIKAKLYAEITALLGMNNAGLKRFFDVNSLSDVSSVSVFIDLIIFRIAAAKQLALEGKTTGLKNREYEDILAKALKIMMFDIGNDIGDDMDTEVIRLAGVPNSYEKEKNLADYLKNNIGTLTQRAFSNTEPDERAVNTLIFLIPFAEANDIEIDITQLAVDQKDIIIKAKAVLSAA